MRGCVRVLRFIVFPPVPPTFRPSNAITSLGSLSRHTHMGALSIIKARLTQTSASRGTVSTEALSNPSVDLQESLAKSVTSLSPDSAALAINTMDKLPDTQTVPCQQQEHEDNYRHGVFTGRRPITEPHIGMNRHPKLIWP